MSLIKLEQVRSYVKAIEGANAAFVVTALSCVEKADPEEITHLIATGTAGKVVLHGSPLRHRLRTLRKQGLVKVNKNNRTKHYSLTEKGRKLAEAVKAFTEALL